MRHACLGVRKPLGAEVNRSAARRNYLDDKQRRPGEAGLVGLLLIDDHQVRLEGQFGPGYEVDGGHQHGHACRPSRPEKSVQRPDDYLVPAARRGRHEQRAVEELVATAVIGDIPQVLVGQERPGRQTERHDVSVGAIVSHELFPTAVAMDFSSREAKERPISERCGKAPRTRTMGAGPRGASSPGDDVVRGRWPPRAPTPRMAAVS